MSTIKVTLFSHLPHNSQILTGFRMLQRQGRKIQITDLSEAPDNPFPNTALIRTDYLGKTIFYDLWDGYQCPDEMRLALDQADFYFKRSFSRKQNLLLFSGNCHKLHPLGFNYHVTCPGTPFAEPLWKAGIKRLLGRLPDRYFTPDKFESRPGSSRDTGKILFLTRLWDEREPGLSDALRQERREINQTRITLIRELTRRFGPRFTGGLNDTPLSRQLAPELIVPDYLTDRKHYLHTVHSSDICIASTGLHESIGWKTGEYVAAGKAIVSQPLCYEVPGNFREGIHYLSYRSVDECLAAVQSLLDDPSGRLAMKQANAAYYQQYLRPDVLVANTLASAEDRAP